MAAPNSPGWYPAPDGNGQQWWNGAGWSESRRNADGSTPGLPGYQAAPPAVPAPSAPVPNGPVPNGPVPLGAPNPYAQPVPSQPAAGSQRIASNPALVALIFSAIGIFAFAPLGVVGIVLGVMALRKTGPTGAGRGMALLAIVLGAIGAVIGLVTLIAGISIFEFL